MSTLSLVWSSFLLVFCVFLFAARARACERSVYVWESFLFYQWEGGRGEGKLLHHFPSISLPSRSLFSAFLPTYPRQNHLFRVFFPPTRDKPKGRGFFKTPTAPPNNLLRHCAYFGKREKGEATQPFLYPHDTLGNVTASKLNKLLFFCSNVPFLIS